MSDAIDVIGGRARWAVDVGDNLLWLKRLSERSVRCCVTSPPYYGLRDYGTGTWEGGDPACDHRPTVSLKSLVGSTLQGGKSTTAHQQEGFKHRRVGTSGSSRPAGKLSGGMDTVDAGTVVAGDCPKCGAVRVNDFQIGLEETPEEYVDALVRVFRRVRRVLTDDGTLWLNLGDSYNAAGRKSHGTRIGYKQQSNRASANGTDANRPNDDVLKPKDLMGIPWKVAFALQADGWYLRADIIWDAPNKMPESVKDRPTQSHEYVFLLAKSEKYYYDAEAIRERATSTGGGASFGKQNHDAAGTGQQSRTYDRPDYEWKNRRSVWSIPEPTRPMMLRRDLPPEVRARVISELVHRGIL